MPLHTFSSSPHHTTANNVDTPAYLPYHLPFTYLHPACLLLPTRARTRTPQSIVAVFMWFVTAKQAAKARRTRGARAAAARHVRALRRSRLDVFAALPTCSCCLFTWILRAYLLCLVDDYSFTCSKTPRSAPPPPTTCFLRAYLLVQMIRLTNTTYAVACLRDNAACARFTTLHCLRTPATPRTMPGALSTPLRTFARAVRTETPRRRSDRLPPPLPYLYCYY